MKDPNFEQRKRDHIRLALDATNEALGGSGLDRIQLEHEAFPELDFDQVSIQARLLDYDMPTPFIVSSMTAGHHDALNINEVIANACQISGWAMGVGSQRKQLLDKAADNEWRRLRQLYPDVKLLGNIGLSQLIHTTVDDIQRLADSLQAVAMFVHTNPLQEVLQPEGTPQFKGGYQAVENLCDKLPIPVVVKETGCGFSEKTLKRLNETGVAAVDISGFGGTHWGRIEGKRAIEHAVLAKAAETFANWGISTVQSLVNAVNAQPDYQIWASGGVRSGLDAAKLLGLGAQIVGFAKPILQAAVNGVEPVVEVMQRIEYELKMALFCQGKDKL